MEGPAANAQQDHAVRKYEYDERELECDAESIGNDAMGKWRKTSREKAGKAGERAVLKAGKACAKPPRKEQTQRLGRHLAAGAAACTLEVNARHTSSKQYARSASNRATRKATAAEHHWTTQRCASVAAKRATTKKNVQRTQIHANGARSEDTRPMCAHIHRDMYQRKSIY